MSEKSAPQARKKDDLQTAGAGAVLVLFAVLFAALLWYADHRPGYQGWDGTPRPTRKITGGTVRWDTALTDKIAAPARAPFALCAVWRGDRVIVTDSATINDGWTHYLALTEDGCIGWIPEEALAEY